MIEQPTFRAVLHPTDFTAGSELAFAHALKIATATREGRRFTILHVERPGLLGPSNRDFPAVRSTLERWGVLSAGSRREDVFNQLAVSVHKVTARGASVVGVVNDYLETHPTDLLVLATRGGAGLPRWIQASVSERLARLSKTVTLFVPQQTPGFVSLDDGSVRLRRILVPIAQEPSAIPALSLVCAFVRTLSVDPVRAYALHVDGHQPAPGLPLPADDRVVWQRLEREGNVMEVIADTAKELSVDLIVMATEGHHGFLDVLRGSTTEQAVRRVPCPLLAVPSVRATSRVPLLRFELPEVAPSTG